MIRFKATVIIGLMLLMSILSVNIGFASRPMDGVWDGWETQPKRYVRMSGNDSNNGRNPNQAWRTLRHALTQIGPGITLCVGAGTYEESDICLLSAANGTSTSRTVIYADKDGAYTGDAGPVILRAFSNRNQWLIRIQNSKWVIFSGFQFEENPNVTNLPDHSTVVDDATYSTWDTAMQQSNLYWPHGIHTSASERVAIHDCYFYGYRHGIHDTDGKEIWALDCDFYNTRYMGIYPWRTNRFHVGGCKFYHADLTKATYNYVFGVYLWNAYVTVNNTNFYGAGNWKELSKLSGRQWRGIYNLYGSGVGSDNVNYTENLGRLKLTNTNFRECNYIAAYTGWMKEVEVINVDFLDCRYGLHAHAETIEIDDVLYDRPLTSTWNATSDVWTDSWGMYVNVFSAPTNINRGTTWRNDVATPAAIVSNIVLNNPHRGLLIASDNVTLNTITINGNCQFENNDRKTGRWLCYSQGIETGWNCSSMEYNNTQNLTFSNLWWCIRNDHGNDTKVTFRNLNIQNNWNAVYCSGTRAEYINCNISNNMENGAYNWWMREVVATNSQFNNNASTDWSGWGFVACGRMVPRNADSSTPGWDWSVEHDQLGTYENSILNVQNCQFNDNGQYRVGGSGGSWIGRFHKNNVILSGNEAKNNHAYGAYFFNCVLDLANNAEFTAITGNWHGLHLDGVWQNQRGTYTVTNYDVSNNYHGILSQYCYCELNNVRSHHNEQYGVYSYLGKVKYRSVTADFNTQGFMLHSNSHHDIRQITAVDNSQHGVWCRLVEAWPATTNYDLYPDFTNYDVQQVTCNRNLYGFSIYGVEYDENAREYPAGMTFPLKDITCNNNRNRGLWVAYGWLDTSMAPLNITCQENGFLDANGNKNGNGIESYNPMTNITLTNQLGINCDSSVANTGIYAWNHNWRYDSTAGANRMSTPNVNLTVDGWNCAGAMNWSVASDCFWNVTVKNVNTNSGHYIANPQGTLLCEDSIIRNGYRGIQVQWGWYENRTDFAAPIQKPVSITVDNCELTGNYHGGFYCDAWTNWQADTKRITISLKDSKFNNTTYHGVLIYNNDAVIENCTADGNGGHALYVWGGNATLRNCSASNNAAGRVNNADGVPQDIGWNAIYLGYPWTPTNGYPDKRYTYTVENCTINNTEGYALHLDNLEGAATVTNTIVNGVTNGTGIDFRNMAGATAMNCTVTGVTTSHGLLAYFVDNAQFVNCTAIGNLHGISAYGRHEQLNSVWVPSNPDATATFTNCVSRDGVGGGHAMISLYNSPTVRGCQLLRHGSYGLCAYSNINGLIENNVIQNNAHIGLRVDPSGNAIIRNNVVTRNAYGIGIYESPTGNVKVWNNTVANNTNWGFYTQRATTVDLANNIFASNGSWGAYFEANSSVTVANNLVNTHSAGDYRHPTRSMDQMRSATDVTKPPRFVDATNGDYRLGKGSPAINAGTPAIDFTTDLLGQARGTYRAWEIGAYEYTAPDGSLRILNWGEQK